MAKSDMLGPLTRALVGVPKKMLGILLDIANRLGATDAEGFYTDLAKFVREWKKSVKEVKIYLRRIGTFTIGSTAQNPETPSEVFGAYLNPDFEKWGIVFSGVVEPATQVAVDELVENGKFSDFLGSTAEELEKRRLLGSQFLTICRDHPDQLGREGYSNFFALTKGDEAVAEDLSNVFVAYVFVCDDGLLYASLSKFRYAYVLHGAYGPRVFSLQQ